MSAKPVRSAEQTINGERKVVSPREEVSLDTWNALIKEIKTRNARIKDAIKETDACQDEHR